MSIPTLRPAHSLENIEFNFRALLGALGAIDGTQVLSGSIPTSALAGSFIPAGGGIVSGTIEAAGLSVGGLDVVTIGDLNTVIGGYYTAAEVDAGFAPLAASYTKGESDARYALAADTYTVAGADAQFATQDAATLTVAGLVKMSQSVADLAQTISGTYTQAEVQAISTKLDELLGKLRTAGVLST